jgi:hypothetical protein
MRKIVLLAVVALIVIGLGMWIGVRVRGPAGAFADSDKSPVMMMTGAKGAPTSHYDDYDLVVH